MCQCSFVFIFIYFFNVFSFFIEHTFKNIQTLKENRLQTRVIQYKHYQKQMTISVKVYRDI